MFSREELRVLLDGYCGQNFQEELEVFERYGKTKSHPVKHLCEAIREWVESDPDNPPLMSDILTWSYHQLQQVETEVERNFLFCCIRWAKEG